MLTRSFAVSKRPQAMPLGLCHVFQHKEIPLAEATTAKSAAAAKLPVLAELQAIRPIAAEDRESPTNDALPAPLRVDNTQSCTSSSDCNGAPCDTNGACVVACTLPANYCASSSTGICTSQNNSLNSFRRQTDTASSCRSPTAWVSGDANAYVHRHCRSSVVGPIPTPARPEQRNSGGGQRLELGEGDA